VLDSTPFSPCYFMGVPLDEFTAPEIAKIAQIAMTDSSFIFGAKDVEGKFGPPDCTDYDPIHPGQSFVCVDPESIYKGKVFICEKVIGDRILASSYTSWKAGNLYPCSFARRHVTVVLPDNECCIKSETD
jgi:hypothetical protein